MADKHAPQMQATLGLTGLTSHAMALIAPGAFLWLTFHIQATAGSYSVPSCTIFRPCMDHVCFTGRNGPLREEAV